MSRQLAIGILVGFAAAMALISWAARAPKPEVQQIDAGHEEAAATRTLPYLHGVSTQRLTIGPRPFGPLGTDGGL